MQKTKHTYRIFLVAVVFIAGTAILHGRVRQPTCYPQIIYITMDAVRADHLSCYGYKRLTSPNIDKLAREGVIFKQAIAQSSHTPASFGVIITANLPNKNSLVSWGDRVSEVTPHLMKILREKGYKTVFLSNHTGISKGVTNFTQQFDIIKEFPVDAAYVTQAAMRIVQSHQGAPLFLWLHYMDTHPPYQPSEKLREHFMHDAVYDSNKKLPIVKSRYDSYGEGGIPLWFAQMHGYNKNPDYYIALYDAAIMTVDEQIGILRDQLERLRIFDKTLLIVSADHGEMLGEKGYYFFHGAFLYEPLLRVPLIMRYKSLRQKNKVVVTQVPAHSGILPTILDILKIKDPVLRDGRSLLPFIEGKVLCFDFSYLISDEGNTASCIRTEEWKLICSITGINLDIPRYELYNIKNNPSEAKVMVPIGKEIFTSLYQRLKAYRQASMRRDPKSALDSAARFRLESLGYMQ